MPRKAEENYSEQQAQTQLESIKEMVANLETKPDEARETIEADPLGVEIREGWHTPGERSDETEYTILLCTGGPAVRIIGELNEYHEPETARLEHQDWGTPWTEYRLSSKDEQILIQYASCFYYGE